MASRPQRSGAILALVLLFFFLSGFAALLYQTIWQRMLGFFSGVDLYSVTIIVAAFMAGLGCGSLVGGRLADRISGRVRLLLFAIAEAAITLFALSSKWLYYDFLYSKYHAFAASPVLLGLILFASLLLPTFCMGATLPILAREFTTRIETAPDVIGYLYGLNTLGAAAGAFTTPWILLRHLGFADILKIGAALNAICAIGAVLVWLFAQSASSAPAEMPTAPTRWSQETLRFGTWTWMLIYALSGFVAIALEIVWFRVLGVVQKSTAFTFPTLVGVYLTGLALGVMIGIPLSKRLRHPAIAFLAFQSAVTLYAGSSLSLLLHQVNRNALLLPLWNYLGSYEPINAGDLAKAIPAWFSGARLPPEIAQSAGLGAFLYFVLPLVLIGPATFLMGLSFPVLQRLVQDSRALLGRRVGLLQALNIAGSMLGAVVVGWILLASLGSSGTLKLLIFIGGTFLLLLIWQLVAPGWKRIAGLAASIVCLTSIALTVPAPPKFWARLHGTVSSAIIAREDGSGVVVAKSDPAGFQKNPIWIFTNGIGQSWLPYGSGHTQIGLLAVALHSRPAEMAVIGLGSGDTAYALSASPQTREIILIEIVEAGRAVLDEVAPRLQDRALDALLSDRRIKWIFTDGRADILRSGRRFDVIEADALRSNSSFSGNLYSWEYFDMLRAHLKPDGLAITWVPTPRVLASFLKSFPHAIVVNGIAVGSQQEIQVDRDTIMQRLADPFTVEHYGRIKTKMEPLLAGLMSGDFQRYSPDLPRATSNDRNSDLFPKDEYMVSASE